jgi:hypothetical protein
VILRELPDPADLLHNPSFRERFYRTWGKCNYAISASSRDVEYPLFQQRLSVKMTGCGRETYFVDEQADAQAALVEQAALPQPSS